MANFKIVQEFSSKAYFLPLPEYGYEVVIKSNQLIDDTSKLGLALLKYYGENVQYEGETKSLMEKVASGDIGGSGTSLTAEQTVALAKIEGLKASASEIDDVVSNFTIYNTIYNIGIPGEIGFGVGAIPQTAIPSGMYAMEGHYDKTSANYGNIIDATGSIMVAIPKFYYKIVGNQFLISSVQYADYVLDRMFINAV